MGVVRDSCSSVAAHKADVSPVNSQDYASTGYIQGKVDDVGVLHIKLNRSPVNAANGQFFFEIGHLAALAKVSRRERDMGTKQLNTIHIL